MHGIVRQTNRGGHIYETSYKQGQKHGLECDWYTGHPNVRVVSIFQNGTKKASLGWTDTWDEDHHNGDVGYLKTFINKSDFKP